MGLWAVGGGAQEQQKTDITSIKPQEPAVPSAGRRDPFKPFIKIIEKKEVGQEVSKSLPPLKRYPLEQFRLTGIMFVGRRPKAMIVDPEKNTYFLGVGDEIGDKQGRIVEVRNNAILVEEKRSFEDVFGQKKIETKRSVLAFKEE